MRLAESIAASIDSEWEYIRKENAKSYIAALVQQVLCSHGVFDYEIPKPRDDYWA
jgi:hypothetical protein